MSQLRKDPIVDRWVIIATERGKRPTAFRDGDEGAQSGFCPLCEGNEDRTPSEIWAIRNSGSEPDSPGWSVRVVPNKFPALAIEGPLGRRPVGMFDMMEGVGAHEVLVESPKHDLRLHEAGEQELVGIITGYKERIADLQRDPRLRYIIVFRNYGLQAGASLDHPHSQLIGMPITPKTVKDKLTAAREHYRRKERCIFCDLIEQELDGERVIAADDDFVVLSPFAARFPYELVIFPRRHSHDFCAMDDRLTSAFARCLLDTLGRLAAALDDPPYNWVLNVAPNAVPRPGRPEFWGTLAMDYHWHLELVPRLTRMAGFEWGTGFHINPVAPEDAAEDLRRSKP
ncbi:MAG: galactose-1-phosphate uridylyltransferase [Armatimonadota bacterium]